MSEGIPETGSQDPTLTVGNDLQNSFEVANLPEWKLLVGGGIAATPEAAQAQPDDAAEAKRTQCSLNCLRYLYEGGDDNYDTLTAVQNDAVKLKREEFDELHDWFKEVLPDEQSFDTMQYVMLIHDAGKNSRLSQEMSLDEHAADHDEVLDLLLSSKQYADQRAALLPTFDSLDSQTQEQIRGVFGVRLNFGQFLQAEAPAAALAGLPEGTQEPVRSMYVMHAMLDIAGVTGHINPDSSMVLTSPTYRSMKAANAALTNPELTSDSARYDYYLAYRAEQLGVSGEGLNEHGDLKAKVRLACMLRYDSREQFNTLSEAYGTLAEPVKAILEAELARDGERDRATLPYYGPAMLKALTDKGDMTSSLTFFAHVLQEAHIADREARAAGQTGVVTAELGELTRSINQDALDLAHAEVRFAKHGNMLVPSVVEPKPIQIENLPTFEPGENLRDKRVIFVGMGGGSDGIQAAMLSKLFQEKYGSQTAAIVSVRSNEKPLLNAGRQVGEKMVEITSATQAEGGWRFLENIPAEGGVIEAPVFVLNSADTQVVKDDLSALARDTNADVVIGVDTGGDSLYSDKTSSADQVVTTPDQDHAVLAAIGNLPKEVVGETYSVVVAPGVDSPNNASEVLQAARANRVQLTPEDAQLVRDTYVQWRMDGTASEEGRYGKTPFAWLAALQGRNGLTVIDLPRNNVVSNNNPWRTFVNVAPAMQSVLIMTAANHKAAVTS